MSVTFSPALIRTPTGSEPSPYVYECSATVLQGTSPYTYQWSPAPESTTEGGRKTRIPFPNNDQQTMGLTVTDSTGCEATESEQVGGCDFTVTNDSGGDGAGRSRGDKDTKGFDVLIGLDWRGNPNQAPQNVPVALNRPGAQPNEQRSLTATRVPDVTPPHYEVPWDVTQAKGRWSLAVPGYSANNTAVKINKRSQIVQVSNIWAGARR